MLEPLRLESVGDPLQFLLVFLVDVRPQDVLGGGTIEVPVTPSAVDILELHDL